MSLAVTRQCEAWFAQISAGMQDVEPRPAEPDPRAEYERDHGLQTNPERWTILPSMEEILAALTEEKAA